MGWTEQSTCSLVVETAVLFVISLQGWIQGLPLNTKPINDRTFQALGVIATSTVDAFL